MTWLSKQITALKQVESITGYSATHMHQCLRRGQKRTFAKNLVAGRVLHSITHDGHGWQSKLFPPNCLGRCSYLQISITVIYCPPNHISLIPIQKNDDLSQVVADCDGNGVCHRSINILVIRQHLDPRCLKPFTTRPTNNLRQRSENTTKLSLKKLQKNRI